MIKDLWIVQEKIFLIAAFGLALFPYVLILRKLILIRLNDYLKSLWYYKTLDKNKVLLKVFYCLINLYFLCWNHVIEEAFMLHRWALNLKNLVLATSTTITSILLINALARITEKLHKEKNSSLILLVQAFKIMSYCAIIAIATHYVFGVSPYSLITSIGITAGFFVVLFKDAILGVIASVQSTLTDSLRIEDQIYLQQYNVEGIVENISPFMIKIRHLDGSTFTFPSHVLLSTCIRNFRDQDKKRNRLTKILFPIATESIHSVDPKIFATALQANYFSQEKTVTNLFAFKVLLKEFLQKKPEIRDLKMIYQENEGVCLPLELTFFVGFMQSGEYQDLKSEILENAFGLANLCNVKFHGKKD
jgi:miniconductance mechanosensitive channel